METLETLLRKLMDEDRIADEVARRIAKRRGELLSWPIKIVGGLVALSALFDGSYRIYMIVIS